MAMHGLQWRLRYVFAQSNVRHSQVFLDGLMTRFICFPIDEKIALASGVCNADLNYISSGRMILVVV